MCAIIQFLLQMPPLPSSEPPLVGDDEMDKMLEGEPSPVDTPIRERDFFEESSSEGATPDMDPQVLFIKLKEVPDSRIISNNISVHYEREVRYQYSGQMISEFVYYVWYDFSF